MSSRCTDGCRRSRRTSLPPLARPGTPAVICGSTMTPMSRSPAAEPTCIGGSIDTGGGAVEARAQRLCDDPRGASLAEVQAPRAVALAYRSADGRGSAEGEDGDVVVRCVSD